MGRRRRFDPDPEIDNYVSAWHRATVTAITAFGLFVAWAVSAYCGASEPTSAPIAVIARLFATAFGWLAVLAALAAAGRAAYAWFYPPWRGQ